METSEKITQLENEIKVLKNEVQAVLLDIRDNFLNAENPFSSPKSAVPGQQAIVERQVQTTAQSVKKETQSTPVQPVREEKQTQDMHTNEALGKMTSHSETSEINAKNDGKNVLETHESNHKDNGKKIPETIPGNLKQTEELEIDLPRFEVSENRLGKRQPDLVAYASLACWVEETTRRLGRDRTQALLELAEISGNLPANMKDVLIKLTNIKSTEHSHKPTAREYFDTLVKIAAFSGNNNDYNAALLLVLSQGDVSG